MTIRLHAGYTALECRDDGSIDGHGRDGLYDVDCRLIRRLRYRLAGQAPVLTGSIIPAAHRWNAVLVARSPAASKDIAGPGLPQDTLELRLGRSVSRGLIDQLIITNHSAARVSAALEVEVEPDFADSMEVGGERRLRGRIERVAAPGRLEWRYLAEHDGRTDERGVRVRVDGAGARGEEGRLTVGMDLLPHASVNLAVTVESLLDGQWRAQNPDGHGAWLERWDATRTRLIGDGPTCAAADRAAADLGALRNDDLFGAESDRSWFPNAGVPLFTGFFGRDALTAGWQAALLGPEMLRGAIEAAARTQAVVDDPWRDAEPGKLVHEIRRGPMSAVAMVPQEAYYGSQTTGAMFALALSEYWHWTGDSRFVRRHLPVVERMIEWADRFGDLDGDGFLEYQRRSSEGLKNQGWKDSDEAIRYPDGTVVANPIATVEEQAFHCLALERYAELLVATGREAHADALLERARDLRRRWDAAFWLPDERFYALALDPDKQAVATVASNAGHALGAGIVPIARARAVAERLFAPNLYSGWGVRTLTSDHPSFNPFAYHLGTVWPVEQATFALGCKRYGFDDLADRIVEDQLAAAVACPTGRLPEVLAGLKRSEFESPVVYPAANSPQAWSASATVQLLQVSLGLYPFAPLAALVLVRPRLPASLPKLTLSGLRVGRARVDLRFTRQPDGTAQHEVIRQSGRMLIVEAGPPQADEGGWTERLSAAGLRLAPGRRFRAARIAMGLETAG